MSEDRRSDPARPDTVGFIGLGAMGAPMARNLLRARGALWVHDVDAATVDALVRDGATAGASPADLAAHCATVLLCLPAAPQVRAVLFGTDGLLAGGAAPTVLDCSTLLRDDALAIAAQAGDLGATYFDCPVSGALPGARDGTLTALFGGTEAGFAAARPILQAFSAAVLYCGGLGSGQAMKAVNNIIYDINIVALCEVLPLAVASGLDPDALAHLVTTGSARSFAAQHFVPRMLARRFDTDFALQDAYKDIQNLRQLAAGQAALLPLFTAMTESYEAALAAGLGAEPKSAILKVYEAALGTMFRPRGPGDGQDGGAI